MEGQTDARRGEALGVWVLLAVAVCWGLTFFSTKDMLDRMPVTDFLSVRFGLATLVLIAIAPKALKMRAIVFWRGALIGTVFAIAMLTQTFGLERTSASVCGFITGLYIVFTPFLGAFLFKARPKPIVWLAVILATIGLAVLALRFEAGTVFGFGEWLVLISALGWAFHITLVGRWSAPGEVMSLTIVQTGVGSVIFLAGGLWDGLTLPANGPDWAWMAFFAVVVGAGTEMAQFWAQTRVEASKAAILMVTEPLWASLFAVLFGGESVTWRLLAGGGLMAAAMIMAILAAPTETKPLAATDDRSAD